MILTPSHTISSLHLSGQSSNVLVQETSDETISSLQMSDEAPLIIPSSPTGQTCSADSEERDGQQDKEQVQLPEWQKAINAAEQQPTSGSSSKEFSVSENSVSTSSESLGSGSSSYPSLQLLQNWQDPNQVDSSSQSVNLAAEKSDLVLQTSASSLKHHSKSQEEEDLKESVQIIGEVQPDRSPHSTLERAETSKHDTESEGAEITDVSSSQDLHLRFSQSQAETETEGVGVHIDAAFKRGFSSGQRTTSSDQLSQVDFVKEDENLQKNITISKEIDVPESKQLTDKPFGGGIEKKAHSKHPADTRLTKSLESEVISIQPVTTDKVSSQPAKGSEVKGQNMEQDRSVTPISLTETSGKDSLLDSNSSQNSGLSFHLNVMMKDGSKMSPFEMKKDLLNAKTPRHSTPIASQDEGNDTSMNQADTEIKNTAISKSTSVAISDQDSVSTSEEPVFHLNVPSKDEIKAIRESPSKKKVSVFSLVQDASFSSTKQLHLQTDDVGDTQDDENPFGAKHVSESSNRVSEKRADTIEIINESESNSSTDTIPVDSLETQHYGNDIQLIMASPQKDKQNQDLLVAVAKEKEESQTVQRDANSSGRKKRRKRGRKEDKEMGKVPGTEHASLKKNVTRDPYEFTESQSNRIPSPLKQAGGYVLTRSKTRGDSNADTVTRKITTRQRKSGQTTPSKLGRKQATAGGEGDKNNNHDQPSDKDQDQSKGDPPQSQASTNPRTTALRTHASVLRQSSSSSSSGGNQRPSSLLVHPEDFEGDLEGPIQIIYKRALVEYKYKLVMQGGRVLKTYEKEVSRETKIVEGSESEDWPTSPTSTSSGYLGDASSLGSRSSSNTGSLQKSVSSKSSSSSASLGKTDSSPAKTPSPHVPLQRAASMKKRSSSSSSSKSPHSAVHFSPELESTASRISNTVDRDATEETFVKPDHSVPRKSVSPKAGSGRKEPSPIQTEMQGVKTMTEKQGGGDGESDTIMVAPPEKEMTEEQSVIVISEGNLESIGRGTGSGIPIHGDQDMSESTILTELPGHLEQMETEVAAAIEGSKEQVSKKARGRSKGRRGRKKSSTSNVARKGTLDTTLEGNGANLSQSVSTLATSQPQSTHHKEEPLDTNLATAAESVQEESQIEILNSPPGGTPKKDESQASSLPYSEEKLSPGKKVLSKWPQDRFYYPSIIKKWIRDNKYLVLFDDLSEREVARGNIICKEWLSKGQPVYVIMREGVIDTAIIIGYHKDTKTKTVGYVIEDSQGDCRKVAKTKVLIDRQQASSLINSCSSSSSDVTLENIVIGKRTTRSSRSQTTPPNSQKKQEKTKSSVTQQSGQKMTGRRSQRMEMTPDREPSETQQSIQTEGSALREESSGSTPRSGVKRKLVSEEGQKEVDVRVRKRLALGKSPAPETPSPEVGSKLRRSPRKRQHPETNKPSLPSTSKSGPTPDLATQKFGSLSDNKTLFKGLTFILTQFELGTRNASSEEGFSRDEMCASTPYNKEFAKEQIKSGGGVILRDLEKAQVSRKNIFLIADSYYRTKKYLLALACGIPCLSHLWLNECCRTGKIQRYQDYLLPAGKSFEEGCVVEWKPQRYDIMSGLRVMLLISVEDIYNTWTTLLLAAGCESVSKLPDNWERKRDVAFTCDVIITDPACPQQVLHHARLLNIPVVSAEWAVQCLINGRRLRYDGNHRYQWNYREID
ncbi:TP53-binding protein 1 [Holothuria leucospilota]|uniref:TP53-binding protein 1 n=1 Tax=Holothuria leucospilota TaxID=206669 RepID=A0A9Q1H023_HOLLE|nr:TP53-binding protein 1 [Holothuria leucospilota]